MDKRYRSRKNSQAKAFDLFSKGYTVFYVAETLDVTIAEARNYKEIFRQSEMISPEHRQDINNFIESGWEKERAESLELLAKDLALRKQKAEYIKLVDNCVEKTLSFAPAADEIVVFSGNFSQVFHWMRKSNKSRLIDIIKNMCFN